MAPGFIARPRAASSAFSIAARTSAASASGAAGTTMITSDEPLMASGTPIAAASRTPAQVSTTSSISAGPKRLPATLMVSSERP